MGRPDADIAKSGCPLALADLKKLSSSVLIVQDVVVFEWAEISCR